MEGAWVPEDTVVLLLSYLSSGFMLHERKINLYFCLSYSSLGPLLSAAKHREIEKIVRAKTWRYENIARSVNNKKSIPLCLESRIYGKTWL